MERLVVKYRRMESDDRLSRRRHYQRQYAQRALARFRCVACDGPCPGRVRNKKTVVCRDCFNAARATRKAQRLASRPPAKTIEEKAVRRVASKERARAYQRQWREAHPGYMAAKRREWATQNPQKARENKRKYRYRRRQSTVDYLMKIQMNRCAYCRVRLGTDFHVDHIVPRSKGGSNKRSNLQLACEKCNIAKGAKDPLLFAQSLGMLM